MEEESKAFQEAIAQSSQSNAWVGSCEESEKYTSMDEKEESLVNGKEVCINKVCSLTSFRRKFHIGMIMQMGRYIPETKKTPLLINKLIYVKNKHK